MVAIWIDEDREHDGYIEAAEKGAQLLTQQEWNAMWGLFLLTAALLFVSGIGIGLGVASPPQDGSQQVLMPPEGDVAQTIAASKNDSIVDAFCADRGFEAGYPSANTGGGYVIRCYDNSGDVDRSKEFSMFTEFADHVAEFTNTSTDGGTAD